MTHPLLDQHSIDDRCGEGRRVTARYRLINDASGRGGQNRRSRCPR